MAIDRGQSADESSIGGRISTTVDPFSARYQRILGVRIGECHYLVLASANDHIYKFPPFRKSGNAFPISLTSKERLWAKVRMYPIHLRLADHRIDLGLVCAKAVTLVRFDVLQSLGVRNVFSRYVDSLPQNCLRRVDSFSRLDLGICD